MVGCGGEVFGGVGSTEESLEGRGGAVKRDGRRANTEAEKKTQ